MRNYDEIKRRNRAFVCMEPVERPLVGIWVGTYMPLKRYKKAAAIFSTYGNSAINADSVNPKDFLEDFDTLFFEHEKIDDDLFWSAVPLEGFPWMEAIIGCSVYASAETYWTKPCLNTGDEFEKIDFSSENKWFRKLLEFRQVLVDHVKKRYSVATSCAPMRGPGDMMGAALGQQRLCLELYDNLGKIKQLASLCTEIWIKIARAQNEQTPRFCNGYLLPFYNIWAPNVFQYMQEDALAYFSPQFYKEILLQNHTKMANSFECPVMHLHPDALYCLNDLYQIDNMRVIEVNRERFGPSLTELIPTFKEIQRRKSLIIWGELTLPEIRELLGVLSPVGLCLIPIVEGVEEGKSLMRRIKAGRL